MTGKVRPPAASELPTPPLGLRLSVLPSDGPGDRADEGSRSGAADDDPRRTPGVTLFATGAEDQPGDQTSRQSYPTTDYRAFPRTRDSGKGTDASAKEGATNTHHRSAA